MNRLAKALECRLCRANNDKVCLPCGHSICVACHDNDTSIQSCTADCEYAPFDDGLEINPVNRDLNLLKHLLISLTKVPSASIGHSSKTKKIYDTCAVHAFMSKTVYCGIQSCDEKSLICALCFSENHSGHIMFNILKNPQKIDEKVVSKSMGSLTKASVISEKLPSSPPIPTSSRPSRSSATTQKEEDNDSNDDDEDSDVEVKSKRVRTSTSSATKMDSQSSNNKPTSRNKTITKVPSDNEAEHNRRQDFWNCLDALNEFHDKNKHYNVPEHYKVKCKSSGKMLYLGDWMRVIKDGRKRLGDDKKVVLMGLMEKGLWKNEVDPLVLSTAQIDLPPPEKTTSRSRSKPHVVGGSSSSSSKAAAVQQITTTQSSSSSSSSRKRPNESTDTSSATAAVKKPNQQVSRLASSAIEWGGTVTRSPHDVALTKPSDLARVLPRRSAPSVGANDSSALPPKQLTQQKAQLSPERVSGDGNSLSDDGAYQTAVPIDPESYTYGGSQSKISTVEDSAASPVHIKEEPVDDDTERMIALMKIESEAVAGSCLAFLYVESEKAEQKIGIGRIAEVTASGYVLKEMFRAESETTLDRSQFDGHFTVDENSSELPWSSIFATNVEMVEVLSETSANGERLFELTPASVLKMHKVEGLQI